MKVEEFKVVLQRLEDLYTAAGIAAPAKDLRSVAKLLEGSEGTTLEEFVSETRALLDRAAKPAPESVINEGKVVEHSTRLLQAGTDQDAFQKALDLLAADNALSTADWYAIANRYRNAPSGSSHIYKFKSLKAARGAIRDVFIERFESQSKRGILDRILRWAS